MQDFEDGDYTGTDRPSGLWEQVTHFPFEELEEDDMEADADEIAIGAITHTLQWFLGFLFYSRKTGKIKPVSVAFKRLLSITYIMRPDLLKGATLDDITVELGESRNALTRYIDELTYMFGTKGLNQQELVRKLEHRFQKLKHFDAERHKRAATVEEWLKNTANAEKSGIKPSANCGGVDGNC